MFYRRKVLLTVLEALGGALSRQALHHHLFLFTRSQDEPAYDFVPYGFGAYSFSLEADHAPLVRAGLLADDDAWRLSADRPSLPHLSDDDQQRLQDHIEAYGPLGDRDLLRLIYTEHPYYAIHAAHAGDVLDTDALDRVRAMHTPPDESALFTIGYEGRSLEAYLNRLVEHDVRILADVRMNPISRKFGFSKRQLAACMETLGREYVHLPNLGIASEKRKGVNTPEAYQRLFEDYEREVLPRRGNDLDRIERLIDTHHRVALTCYEANATDCHRSRVARALAHRPGWRYEVHHV